MSLGVVCLQLGEPGADLADSEPQFTAGAEPARAATLAAQVVEGLDGATELGGELGQGQDGPERCLGLGGGLHADQVR
jgi:hypothetical protein